MNRIIKLLLVAALCLVCTFTMLGYAGFTSYMEVSGEAHAAPPEAVHVTAVTAGSEGTLVSETHRGTLVTTNIELTEVSGGTYRAKYVIDFWNNTNETYYYLAMVHGTFTDGDGTQVAYSNPNIELATDIALGDEIAAGARRSVTVTATFAKGADTSDKTLTSVIEYQFTTEKPENNDEAAVSGVLSRFPEILNDSETMAELTAALDANTTHPDYIGNVVGFWGINNDIETVENLFGVALELNVDGENKPVTVIIQRANVDGDEQTGDSYTYTTGWGNNQREETVNGCEMIMYMTAADLDSVSGGSYVEVFAVVFTRDADGTEWYQTGEMYRGSARVVGYVFGTTLAHDSFNPDTWRQLDENGNRTDTTIADIITALP